MIGAMMLPVRLRSNEKPKPAANVETTVAATPAALLNTLHHASRRGIDRLPGGRVGSTCQAPKNIDARNAAWPGGTRVGAPRLPLQIQYCPLVTRF